MSTTTQIPTRTTPARRLRGHDGSGDHREDGSAAGVSFADGTGASIPTAAFAQLTLVFSLVGVGIAAVIARKARRPRATFVRTAVALTALSFVPDLAVGFDAGSAATLITLHTVAAAIVVPTLARRLTRALTTAQGTLR
jgi:uncharacterized membrane protein YoaK (UPF0700 family)